MTVSHNDARATLLGRNHLTWADAPQKKAKIYHFHPKWKEELQNTSVKYVMPPNSSVE